MSSPPQHHWQRLPAPGAGWRLALDGDWRGAAVLTLAAPPPGCSGPTLQVEASGLTGWDAGLAAALREHLAPLALRGVALQLDSLPPQVRALLVGALPAGDALAAGSGAAAVAGAATLSDPPVARPSAPPSPGGLATLGQRLVQAGQGALRTATFAGEVLLGLGRLLRPGRSGMRGAELWRQIDQTGPQSLGIVALTCALVGLMLAYMGGAQLDRMGAQSFIADIVTVGMVRELAGLFTGVILAGRVGSAFAAQLATMQAGEEIDALRVLGVDPVDHLVMPRVLALVLVAPLLMAYGALAGVVAGLLPAAAVYGVPPAEYLHRCLGALSWTHLWVGLFKGTLYAALLALAGCREGLHAGRNAQAVGEATTRAVVKGLVWIIAAACLSTAVFQSLGL